MQKMNSTSTSTLKVTAHDRLITILAPEDNPSFSQRREHVGKGGAPHSALLPERLRGREIKSDGIKLRTKGINNKRI